MSGQGLGGGTRGMKSWRAVRPACMRSIAVTWNGEPRPTLRPHTIKPGVRCPWSGVKVNREATYLPTDAGADS